MAYRSTHTGAQIDDGINSIENLGETISGKGEKATPVDADVIGISDSAASGALKKLSWSNIKATIKAYFDSVYIKLNQSKYLWSDCFRIDESKTIAAVGTSFLIANTTGHNLAGLGYGVLLANTEGYDNVGAGSLALRFNTTGSGLVAVGNQALLYNTTAYYNVAIGDATLKNTIGPNNTAVGAYAGHLNTTGGGNVFVGQRAGYNQTTASNKLIIDDRQRADAASDLTKALIVGTFADATANQELSFNAKSINLPYLPTYADNNAATSGGLSAGELYKTSSGQLMVTY